MKYIPVRSRIQSCSVCKDFRQCFFHLQWFCS